MDIGAFWFPAATTLAAVVGVVGRYLSVTLEDEPARAIWHVAYTAAVIALGIAWGLTIVGPRLVR